MIGRLRGQLISTQAPLLMVDVGGVGYEIEAPMTTFYNLPELGEPVTLYTHLVVREDAHLLFGFHSDADRSLFRALIKINGVGAKLALTILSGMSTEELVRCVDADDIASLTRLPGVGKKTAERLIVEMRDRLKALQAGPTPSGVSLSSKGIPESLPSDAISDAVSALVALGYKGQEASRMVRGVEHKGQSSEEIIRAALKGAMAKV